MSERTINNAANMRQSVHTLASRANGACVIDMQMFPNRFECIALTKIPPLWHNNARAERENAMPDKKDILLDFTRIHLDKQKCNSFCRDIQFMAIRNCRDWNINDTAVSHYSVVQRICDSFKIKWNMTSGFLRWSTFLIAHTEKSKHNSFFILNQ